MMTKTKKKEAQLMRRIVKVCAGKGDMLASGL
jgi:hypothetical protein